MPTPIEQQVARDIATQQAQEAQAAYQATPEYAAARAQAVIDLPALQAQANVIIQKPGSLSSGNMSAADADVMTRFQNAQNLITPGYQPGWIQNAGTTSEQHAQGVNTQYSMTPIAVATPTNNNMGIQSVPLAVSSDYVPFASPQGQASSSVGLPPPASSTYTPIALMPENAPMAQVYNNAALAMNAARQPGATQAGVQGVLNDYNNFTYQNYNPQKGDIIQRLYMPEGNYAQQEFSNVKAGMAYDANGKSTGEFGLYEQLPNGRMNIDPNTGLLSNWELIGGGGRNFLQSGTAGFAAATPAVYARGGVGTGAFKTPDVMAPGVMSSGITAAQILANPSLYSRLGAEGYGGIVTKQDGRTLGNITYEDVTNRASWNFASYVNPTDVNLAKVDLPGVNIPWSVTDNAPALFALTTKGGVGAPMAIKMFDAYVGGGLQTTKSDRLIGGNKVAGIATVTPVMGDMGLPRPFVSNGIDATKSIEEPTGKIFGFEIPGLAFFQQGKSTNTKYSYGMTPVTTEVTNTPTGTITTTSGGKTYIQTKTVASTPSGFDSFLGTTNIEARQYLGLDKLPTPTSEQYKQYAPQISLLPGAQTIGIALQTPVISDYAASYLKGEGEGLLQNPINAAAAFGAGVALGVVGKGVGVGYEATRVSFAEKAITEGGGWRAAEQYAANVPKVAGVVLGGAYVGSVAARTTSMGTDFSPASTERLGGIMATEAIPGGFGVVAGMRAPGAVYNAARISDIGYKAELQEGNVVNRLDYYALKPIESRLDSTLFEYKSFTPTEAGISKPLAYVEYKTGLGITPASESTTLKYTPGQTGELAELAYGKQNTIFDYLSKGTYESPTTLKYSPSELPMGAQAEAAYGTPRTIFDMSDATVAPEPTTLKYVPAQSGEITSLAYPEASQPLSMRITSYLQENKPFENLQINLKYPAKEIAQTNKLSVDFNKAYSGKDVTIREPITPLSKTFSSAVKSNVGRTPSPYKSKPSTAESIGSGGQVSVSVSSSVEPTSSPVMDSGWRGTPEYPSLVALLSPRQKYQTEEETQYLTLPPGMTSPSNQNTSTITYVTPIQSSGSLSKSAMSEVAVARDAGQLSSSRSVYQPVLIDTSLNTKSAPFSLNVPKSDSITRQITDQFPIQDTTLKQIPELIITPAIDQITTPKTTQIITPTIPVPGLPLPFFGGGGGTSASRNPSGPRHTEIFSYAPKNLKGLFGMPKGRTPAIKKRK